MGKIVLKKPLVEVNFKNLTTRISSVSMNLADDEVDASTFGSVWKETAQGLSDADVAMTFTQDFAAESVDAILWPLKTEGKRFIIKVKPDEGATSATNPSFMMGAQLYGYSPISGATGELSTTDVSFKNCTSKGIIRCKEAAEEATAKTDLENAGAK